MPSAYEAPNAGSHGWTSANCQPGALGTSRHQSGSATATSTSDARVAQARIRRGWLGGSSTVTTAAASGRNTMIESQGNAIAQRLDRKSTRLNSSHLGI